MRQVLKLVTFCALGLAFVAACDKQQSQAPSEKPPATVQATLPAGFILDKAPEGATDIGTLKAAGVKDGQEVTVRGIVGGSEHPFVNNRAVVQIIDPSVKTCDKTPGDACKTPWDACCDQDNSREKSASVEVIDAAGNPLKATLEGVAGLKPLSEIIVRGKARSEGKSIVIYAASMYVKK